MKSVPKRISEYVKYHINGDCECNGVLLKSWADKHDLSNKQRFDLCYFFAITYCVQTAIILYLSKEQIFADTEKFVQENKQRLLFQSDRKYIKMQDSLKECLVDFKHLREDSFASQTEIDLAQSIEQIKNWRNFGRFSAYLFIETYIALTNTKVTNSNSIEWVQGSTVTSGILNVFGLDKSADFYDKNKKLPERLSVNQLDKMLKILQDSIKAEGGDDNTAVIETSLCAYRKHYKGTRYNGYYLDRQLEEILYYKQTEPQITSELLELRKEIFNKKYLGELNGWRGIRKELKKHYKDTGVVL